MPFCSNCGRELKDSEVMYGSDGLPYCSSCVHLADSTQCFKCGIRLPRSEMQMYKGQYYCQYCFMDTYMNEKDRERREDDKRRKETEKDDKKRAEQTKHVGLEHCEICGAKLYTVYNVNGMHLCKNCADNVIADMKRKGKKPNKYAVIHIRNRSLGEAIGEEFIQKPKNKLVMAIKRILRIEKKNYPEIVQVSPKKPIFIANAKILDDKWRGPKFTPLTDNPNKRKKKK